MLDLIDQQAESEGLAIKRLSTLRPFRRLKPKRQRNGKPTNYPRIRRKNMTTESETKSEKFARLANKRTNKALKAISLIGNLSSAQYGYSDDDVQKIEQALYACIETTMAGFNKAKIAKPVFSL